MKNVEVKPRLLMKAVCMIPIMLALVFHMTLDSTSYAAQTLTISGSSTVKPIVETAAVAFKKAEPNVQIIVGGGGSSGGVKNCGQGKVSIGMASRKIKDKEKAIALS